ncbi:MAG: hypothetical protein HYV94_21160 [Candidatus Rokubacteria bacterium]|nr:hypothetical protein [Candidatus Rokubacteria bacterium]
MAPREVRQPEVTRLARLLLALLLVVPVVQAGASMALAVAFLVEFLSEGRSRPLSALTREPGSAPLAVPGVAVDRFTPAGAGRPLVLVHGLTPEGKDDPRARAAAALLARAGFDVALPTVPGLTRARLRRDDVEAVVATLAARAAPAVVVGVSVGAGPALLAAADARVRDRVRAVLTLGGYASARELIRFHLTGTYGFAGISGRVRPDPRAVDLVVAANADLLDASARALVAARDPAAAERALTALSPELGRLLDALSPLSVVGDLRARLVLVHGRGDPAVPYTGSLRRRAARPGRTTVAIVVALDHVEGARAGIGSLVDALVLWRAAYALLAPD